MIFYISMIFLKGIASFQPKKNWPSLLDVVRVGSVGTHPQDPGEKGQSIGGIGAPILIKTDDRYWQMAIDGFKKNMYGYAYIYIILYNYIYRIMILLNWIELDWIILKLAIREIVFFCGVHVHSNEARVSTKRIPWWKCSGHSWSSG